MNKEKEDLGSVATDIPNANQEVTPTKGKFGVSKDAQGGSAVSIPAAIKLATPSEIYKTGYEFPIGKLVNVAFDPAKKMKMQGVETERPVLVFVFKDNKNRVLTHIEFPIDDDDAKFESKMDWMNQRIKHIWEESIGDAHFPEEGLGATANNFSEFFADVADKFNGVRNGDVSTYSQTPMYVKVVYNKSRLNFPLFPNFLQRAKQGDSQVPVINLTIDPTRDIIELSAKANTGYSGGDVNFGGATGGVVGGDFPDI